MWRDTGMCISGLFRLMRQSWRARSISSGETSELCSCSFISFGLKPQLRHNFSTYKMLLEVTELKFSFSKEKVNVTK